jgi:signal transduction histidine kinase
MAASLPPFSLAVVGPRSRPRTTLVVSGSSARTRRHAAAARTVRAVEEPLVQLARVPRRPPRADVLLAAVLAVWAVLEALFVSGPGSTASRVVTALLFTVPLAWRRRYPIPVLLGIVGVMALRGALSEIPEAGAMPFPALLVAVFSAALYGRPMWAAAGSAVVPLIGIGVALATGYFEGSPGPVDFAIISFFSLGAWTAGWLVRRRAAQVEQARREGPELAREAVAAERARMARELHDVVAHSVSIIAVQAGAAEAQLDRDPEQARPHLDAVRRTAHEALVELRRLVGVLREDDAVYAPQPGLEQLGELLGDARAAGLPVELVVDGARRPLPAGVDLAAYRVVQEALTNVRRHAGAAATTVRLAYAAEALDVEVVNAAGRRNGAVGPGSGHGLIGMAERVRIYGGTLETGVSEDGGFRVRAHLPLEAGS